ncbi:ATP-binding protein [Shewanella chilikensis]|uniref:ATP-binding protein n=1 Tax=Shewanella chilikensis TaxID=558541 RepID=UPI003D1623A1
MKRVIANEKPGDRGNPSPIRRTGASPGTPKRGWPENKAKQQKEVNFQISEELELPIYPRPLSRAIENLQHNAIRYCRTQVNICAQDKGQWVEISITYDGPGIEESELEAIFKPTVAISRQAIAPKVGLRSSSIYHATETFRLILQTGLAA